MQKLHVEGIHLKNERNEDVQLRGISTHGIAWYPQFINCEGFKDLKENWKANVVRLAMYTAEHDAYCSGGDQAFHKELIKKGVEYAVKNDLYVLIDWHILSDNDPRINEEAAAAFFEEMSALYAGCPNVIYELCNEPNGDDVTWPVIKGYAERIIPIIRKNDPESVILVGTPCWSQRVDEAEKDRLDFENVMYVLHFYADTHRDELRARMEKALNDGLPVFVTEFGICDASGDGNINYEESEKWMELIDRYGVSYCEWNYSNCDEAAAMIKADCTRTNGFTPEDLRESGSWLFERLNRY